MPSLKSCPLPPPPQAEARVSTTRRPRLIVVLLLVRPSCRSRIPRAGAAGPVEGEVGVHELDVGRLASNGTGTSSASNGRCPRWVRQSIHYSRRQEPSSSVETGAVGRAGGLAHDWHPG